MGFYSKGVIYPLIPKIEEVRDDVVMEKNLHKGRLGELVNFLLERSLRLVDQRYQGFSAFRTRLERHDKTRRCHPE